MLAAGGLLICGTKRRKDFTCDFAGQIGALTEWARDDPRGLPDLRTYWYDGAPNGVPTAEHLRIAALPYVKIRLGRLIQGEQKGVDALIYRDLMTLARERAISRAILVAGDEDLREGVVAAQDMGVEVVIVGIETTQRTNQSAALIREADEHIMLPREFWEPFFSLKEERQEVPESPELAEAAREAARAFALEWAGRAEPDEIFRLLQLHPRIPKELDVQLMDQAEQTTGSLRERQDLKHELRASFWRTIEEAAKSTPPTSREPATDTDAQ